MKSKKILDSIYYKDLRDMYPVSFDAFLSWMDDDSFSLYKDYDLKYSVIFKYLGNRYEKRDFYYFFDDKGIYFTPIYIGGGSYTYIIKDEKGDVILEPKNEKFKGRKILVQKGIDECFKILERKIGKGEVKKKKV